MRDSLREIPSVSQVLALVDKQAWGDGYSREQIVRAIRQELAEIRLSLQGGGSVPEDLELLAQIEQRLRSLHDFSLKRVINATGIIVHTNLGRAPLSQEAISHVEKISRGYSNLEMDLSTGQRGSREVHLEKFLRELLSVESALAVNNNAAALLLILNTLAEGKEVIVSRGELVEIGGSFRLPEIMKKSGVTLREVGATNKTKLADYRSAITAETAMILVVHPSNFQIVGFTEKPQLHEIVTLGHQHNLPVVEDHGSGILVDLEPFGITGEPSAHEQLTQGIDLICFSGDKILGGPQAGIVAGKKLLVERLRKNPLFRALRVDKMVYSALEATLASYLKGISENIPVLKMASRTTDELKSAAEKWKSLLESEFPGWRWGIAETRNFIGGGVAPMKDLPSFAVYLQPDQRGAEEIARALRLSDPPVISRIEEGKIFFELRTLTGGELAEIVSVLKKVLRAES